jgi:RNA recognition motif-containing protein
MKSRTVVRRSDRSSVPYNNNNNNNNKRSNPNYNNKRLYVNNLAWESRWQDLKDHFKTIGPVTRADILEQANGRSKGCGIVEYQKPADARRAVEILNNSELNGRIIYVREDREAPTIETKSSNRNNSSQQIQQRPAKPGCRVYVGNLSWDVQWQDLKDYFKSAGFSVRKADIIEDQSGRSKGCGLVEFLTPDDADEAIERLNQSDLMGRQIFIRHDKDDVSNDSDAPVKYGDSGEVYGCKLYVGNLSFETTWQSLKDHFKSNGGSVSRADVTVNEETGRSKGYGIVEFSSPDEAQEAARDFNNSTLDGRVIFVREDRDERSKAVKGYN